MNIQVCINPAVDLGSLKWILKKSLAVSVTLSVEYPNASAVVELDSDSRLEDRD